MMLSKNNKFFSFVCTKGFNLAERLKYILIYQLCQTVFLLCFVAISKKRLLNFRVDIIIQVLSKPNMGKNTTVPTIPANQPPIRSEK